MYHFVEKKKKKKKKKKLNNTARLQKAPDRQGLVTKQKGRVTL